eukprot:Colp12_sorted_trinity150504_noHs@21041
MAQYFKSAPLKRLVNGALVDVDPSTLEGKKVLIYFSAHWCPPCRGFTPVLKEFYEDVKEQQGNIEIIFISSDRSVQDQIAYMQEAHGDWLTIPMDSVWTNSVKQKYGVRGIPTLTVIQANGDVINPNARGEVQAKGPAAFTSW